MISRKRGPLRKGLELEIQTRMVQSRLSCAFLVPIGWCLPRYSGVVWKIPLREGCRCFARAGEITSGSKLNHPELETAGICSLAFLSTYHMFFSFWGCFLAALSFHAPEIPKFPFLLLPMGLQPPGLRGPDPREDRGGRQAGDPAPKRAEAPAGSRAKGRPGFPLGSPFFGLKKRASFFF